jgi:hypothetical protein
MSSQTVLDLEEAWTGRPSIEKSALQVTDVFEDVPVPAIESLVWRKFDWRILPVVFIFHFLAFLVRLII